MTSKTIFLITGKTFTFRNVSGVIENETSLSFNYWAMSDGKFKKVSFYRPGIVGHSTYDGPSLGGTDKKEEKA